MKPRLPRDTVYILIMNKISTQSIWTLHLQFTIHSYSDMISKSMKSWDISLHSTYILHIDTCYCVIWFNIVLDFIAIFSRPPIQFRFIIKLDNFSKFITIFYASFRLKWYFSAIFLWNQCGIFHIKKLLKKFGGLKTKVVGCASQ